MWTSNVMKQTYSTCQHTSAFVQQSQHNFVTFYQFIIFLLTETISLSIFFRRLFLFFMKKTYNGLNFKFDGIFNWHSYSKHLLHGAGSPYNKRLTAKKKVKVSKLESALPMLSWKYFFLISLLSEMPSHFLTLSIIFGKYSCIRLYVCREKLQTSWINKKYNTSIAKKINVNCNCLILDFLVHAHK